MAEEIITHFDPDPRLLEPLLPATEYHDPLDPDDEWPGNILSRRTIVYGDGTIARRSAPVAFAADPGELALCRNLAAESVEIMEGVATRDYPFQPFFIAARADTPAPTRIEPDLIRARFGGTIFRLAEVSVEPMAESGSWWTEVEASHDEESGIEGWRSMVRWFAARPEFVDSAFVRIGENLVAADDLPMPPDVEQFGVVMPRLAVGLTAKGSLAGWCVCVVKA